jgi:hypothetical protein
VALYGIIFETLRGDTPTGDYGSWSADIPLVPPPDLTPVPFVTADAGLAWFGESGGGNVQAFFPEYRARDPVTGISRTVPNSDFAGTGTIVMDSNVDSVTIGFTWAADAVGSAVYRILLFG